MDTVAVCEGTSSEIYELYKARRELFEEKERELAKATKESQRVFSVPL